MARRAERVDANQPEIVAMYRQMGCSVKHTHTLKGFVDLVVGISGHNALVEVKDGTKPPSAQKLTDAEFRFHEGWRGNPPVIVRSAADVVEHVSRVRREMNAALVQGGLVTD